jgi:glycosidase
MSKQIVFFKLAVILLLSACTTSTQELKESDEEHKIVVYQVFTRLFGNTNTTNKQWGTLEENGVGKFNDFTETALKELKALGVTHMWYTGVPHHAVITDYTEYGISNDDPDVVKGRAGSPYAVKDYYNVNPDLAVDPAKRLEEFKALIERTHAAGMKVVIDIVPNHVARDYIGLTNPEGVEDFGASDDTSVEYARDNNFYYIPGEKFIVPESLNDYKPLGGDEHPLSDGEFEENPAKWTGNGARKAQPHFYDWYETVKINYGVKPDGSYDFDTLPAAYAEKSHAEHATFWESKDVPNSWDKFKDITHYWIDLGVDGFRFDMAEMVPVEFWSYMNSSIKMKNPEAFLLAEVYQPHLYRDYIHKGKMDYLYDKVWLYDTLKNIIRGYGSTDNIVKIQEDLADIEHHMLHFLENHDEQRIASPDFAGDAQKGKPMMVLSATISTAPTMMYFGQEVGVPGEGDAGFGDPTRTTIFDYWGVPAVQRWMNDGAFDGGKLTEEEVELRDFYKRILNLTIDNSAFMGEYKEIHTYNRENTEMYTNKVYSFVRYNNDQKILVISNFSGEDTFGFDLKIPAEVISELNLENKTYTLQDLLYNDKSVELVVNEGVGTTRIELEPLQSFVFSIE